MDETIAMLGIAAAFIEDDDEETLGAACGLGLQVNPMVSNS